MEVSDILRRYQYLYTLLIQDLNFSVKCTKYCGWKSDILYHIGVYQPRFTDYLDKTKGLQTPTGEEGM